MKLTFIGADHEVTGSCHYLQAAGKNILVDYGMEQGRNTFENAPLPLSAGDIDYVFVTHAHIDHTGLLPQLSAQGFHGKIFATYATCDLCQIMLLDSAHIQEFEAEWRNRKGMRKGLPAYVPLYTTEDAEKVCQRFIRCPYDQEIDVCENIRIRFNDVGHLLGSAAIEVWVKEDGEETKIVFSGDVGNTDQPLLKEPKKISEADYLLIESTYGDRSHGEKPDYRTALAEILQRTFDRGGNVVIPSFAVGRTQEMLYIIREIKEQNLVKGHEDFPVYVDSPLAVRATGIFNRHNQDCFDGEAQQMIADGINPIDFPGLELATTSDESRAINLLDTPKVILSASGMCDAGRIKHHLKHNLWRRDSTILFVGYQAEGSLGRELIEGEKEVTLFGETIKVQAEIKSLKGISGHADREGLLDWASGFTEKPKKVFVVHGDDTVVQPFADLLQEKLGFDTFAPYSGTVWDLTNNVCEKMTEGIPFVKRDENGVPITEEEHKAAKKDAPFIRLENALKRLAAVVHSCRGLPNKDLARFAEQIQSLCDKWKQE
ncbi:MAG: MBL fold metallo-hydrolase [Lachnospiraceae bacterium]|nr:MBL fold metallo-hydrolase [Lachnospiraceae bacterium]